MANQQKILNSFKLLDMDATAVVEAYHTGMLKPSEAVEIYIAHQKRFNSDLNLVVEERYDQAQKEATNYDVLLSEGCIEGKLFGVPISIKEAFDVKNMHTTGGLSHNKNRLIKTDAEVIKRLKKEGAIILDKTNTPTLCFCQETDNYLFGRSNNPWNKSYTPGGSSGGEAALIAVGGAAAGLGSDIGGSIRIPSHFNGVIGFKPGAFQFPDDGHFPPILEVNQKPMLGFGPIVKSVRDAALMYSIIHPSFQPPISWELPGDLNVVSFGSFHKTKCTKDTLYILHKAQESLCNLGATLQAKPPSFMKDVPEIWQLIMSEDGSKGIIELAYPDNPRGFYIDYFRAKLRLKAANHPYLSWAAIGTNMFSPNKKQRVWIQNFIQEGHRQLEELFGPNGIFIIPAYPSPAKKHGQIYAELFSITRSFRWVLPFTALANVFGLPAIVIPCARSGDGLPINLQVVSRVGDETLLFKVAAFLESEFGGYRRNGAYD